MNSSAGDSTSELSDRLPNSSAHETGFSVLLNRIGRSLTNSSGRGSETAVMQVTLSDEAADDIHWANIDGTSGQVTGSHQPSARLSDPANTFDTSERSAFLSEFNNLNPNGRWVLYVADVAAGDQSTLVRWGVTITQIPEPRLLWLLAVSLASLFMRRQRSSVPFLSIKCASSVAPSHWSYS